MRSIRDAISKLFLKLDQTEKNYGAGIWVKIDLRRDSRESNKWREPERGYPVQGQLMRNRLRGADPSCAILSNANLNGANLRKANLNHAELRDADLTGADLSWENLTRR